jgi:hypothetical protein
VTTLWTERIAAIRCRLSVWRLNCVSGDGRPNFIGRNWGYADGGWPTRSRIWKAHQSYIRGLLYFLATSPRLPEELRGEMQAWGFCKDEFQDTGGWPHAMYNREARRMVSSYVVTQADCEHRTTITDSVGLGSYNMDSHNCERIVKNGAAQNEGDVQVGPKGPYAVPYRAIVPRIEDCENLIVPVAVSASHMPSGRRPKRRSKSRMPHATCVCLSARVASGRIMWL